MRSPDPLTVGEKRRLTWLAKELVAWGREHGRHFPWRSSDVDIYGQVISEVLLQRKTATAVARFYEAFVAR